MHFVTDFLLCHLLFASCPASLMKVKLGLSCRSGRKRNTMHYDRNQCRHLAISSSVDLNSRKCKLETRSMLQAEEPMLMSVALFDSIQSRTRSLLTLMPHSHT